ncbi:hypothetical protein K435DRAFT_813711 [Dendrothele bispora CBS 962.96]|uniref:Uncharacterized protein n=1 Tax=Dendrothele bispora (strain CBS 962.96) TaxID=1314807 RepID=A0A4S8KKQ4_DENBC|nr:hypothetical protein K435DRAFT_813711 [Dendrothele bispora CBS 962.96]
MSIARVYTRKRHVIELLGISEDKWVVWSGLDIWWTGGHDTRVGNKKNFLVLVGAAKGSGRCCSCSSEDRSSLEEGGFDGDRIEEEEEELGIRTSTTASVGSCSCSGSELGKPVEDDVTLTVTAVPVSAPVVVAPSTLLALALVLLGAALGEGEEVHEEERRRKGT